MGGPLPRLTALVPLLLNVSETLPSASRLVQGNDSLLVLHTAEEQWEDLIDFREILLIFCLIGAILFIIHTAMLVPNVVQSFRIHDPYSLEDTGNSYFRNLLKMLFVMLIFERIVFDIPLGCFTMELLSLVWEGPSTTDNDLNSSEVIL